VGDVLGKPQEACTARRGPANAVKVKYSVKGKSETLNRDISPIGSGNIPYLVEQFSVW
jgi:hypothetical protein